MSNEYIVMYTLCCILSLNGSLYLSVLAIVAK